MHFALFLKSTKYPLMSIIVLSVQEILTEGEGSVQLISSNTNSNQLLFILSFFHFFYRSRYLNKEVYSTVPSVSVLWSVIIPSVIIFNVVAPKIEFEMKSFQSLSFLGTIYHRPKLGTTERYFLAGNWLNMNRILKQNKFKKQSKC